MAKQPRPCKNCGIQVCCQAGDYSVIEYGITVQHNQLASTYREDTTAILGAYMPEDAYNSNSVAQDTGTAAYKRVLHSPSTMITSNLLDGLLTS